MKTREYPKRSEEPVNRWKSLIGLAFRENWGCVPDRFDDQFMDE
jgi:hypothetical protein